MVAAGRAWASLLGQTDSRVEEKVRGTDEGAGLTRPVLLWLLGPCGEGPGSVPTAYPGSGALSFHVTHQALS